MAENSIGKEDRTSVMMRPVVQAASEPALPAGAAFCLLTLVALAFWLSVILGGAL